MKRICIISQYFSPDVGGAVARLNNILKALNDFDLEIFIVTAVPHYPNGLTPQKYHGKRIFIEKGGNLKIFRLRIATRPQNTFINRLTTYISFLWMSLFAIPLIPEVDLIWVTSPNFFGNIIGIFFKAFKRTPLILNIDDLWPDVVVELGFVKNKFIIRFADFLNYIAYHYCEKITPISHSIRRRVIQKYKIKNDKIQVIEVGIDTNKLELKLDKIKEKGNFLDNEMNEYLNKKNILIYSGILGPAYDFKLLLNSAKLLEKEKVLFYMLIQGEGDLSIYINKMICNLNLKRVKLFNFALDDDSHLYFLLKAKILLLPMRGGIFASTAIPAKLFTYLMTNKPIISTTGTEIEEILRESSSGLSVPHNQKSLANAIQLLLSKPEVYSDYQNNGLKYVNMKFSVEKIGQKIEKLLNSVIG